VASRATGPPGPGGRPAARQARPAGARRRGPPWRRGRGNGAAAAARAVRPNA